MSDAIRWYDANAEDVSRRYESVAAETVHGWLVDLLPAAPALVLDVGAGTGRDAAWLASPRVFKGSQVVARISYNGRIWLPPDGGWKDNDPDDWRRWREAPG